MFRIETGRRRVAAGLLAVGLLAVACVEEEASRAGDDGAPKSEASWSAVERAILASLRLSASGPPPAAPSNRVADDPRAASLGRKLFFDPALSRDGRIACSTCHLPDLYYADGLPTSRGLGPIRRNAPTIVGAAYSPWQFWDGRRDSLWSQALAPFESASEMGSTRLAVVRAVTHAESPYAAEYRALFGEPPALSEARLAAPQAGPFGDPEARAAWERIDPAVQGEIDRAFANIGKAIAAWERTVRPAPARFDRFVDALLGVGAEAAAKVLTPDERAGLRLFLDAARTRCLQCHSGPLFSNFSFHDIGTGRLSDVPDLGRFLGLRSLRLDRFNCLGPHSDAPEGGCEALRFLDVRNEAHRSGAFRTPSLRGVADTAPYFHDGSLADLDAVITYYRNPPTEPPNELVPLDLDDDEARQLVAFLSTLSGGFEERPSAAAQP